MEMIEAADNAAAFRRLHALIGRGYRPDFGTRAVTDAIWLEHPGKGLRNVILCPDGLVMGWAHAGTPDRDKLRIQAADDRTFDDFIRATPLPNLWEKTEGVRIRWIAYLLIFGLPWLLILLAQWLFDAVRAPKWVF
jgi:hypothetical protein